MVTAFPEGEERKNGSKSAVCQIDLTVLLPGLFTIPSCAGLKIIPIFNEKSFCHTGRERASFFCAPLAAENFRAT